VGGVLKRYLAPQTLGRLLRTELCSEEDGDRRELPLRLRQKLNRNRRTSQNRNVAPQEKGEK